MLLGKTLNPSTRPRLFDSHTIMVSEKNSMSPSNVEWGHAPSAVAAFLITSKAFVSNMLIHKIMAS